jgi:hypothetical protein
MPYKNYKFCLPTRMEPPHPPARVFCFMLAALFAALSWNVTIVYSSLPLRPCLQLSQTFVLALIAPIQKHLILPISSNTCSYLWVNMFTLTFLWVLMPPQSWTRKGKDTGGCRPSKRMACKLQKHYTQGSLSSIIPAPSPKKAQFQPWSA